MLLGGEAELQGGTAAVAEGCYPNSEGFAADLRHCYCSGKNCDDSKDERRQTEEEFGGAALAAGQQDVDSERRRNTEQKETLQKHPRNPTWRKGRFSWHQNGNLKKQRPASDRETGGSTPQECSVQEELAKLRRKTDADAD